MDSSRTPVWHPSSFKNFPCVPCFVLTVTSLHKSSPIFLWSPRLSFFPLEYTVYDTFLLIYRYTFCFLDSNSFTFSSFLQIMLQINLSFKSSFPMYSVYFSLLFRNFGPINPCYLIPSSYLDINRSFFSIIILFTVCLILCHLFSSTDASSRSVDPSMTSVFSLYFCTASLSHTRVSLSCLFYDSSGYSWILLSSSCSHRSMWFTLLLILKFNTFS